MEISHNKHLICTDSLTQCCARTSHHRPSKSADASLTTILHFLLMNGLTIAVIWIYSHVVIPGNELADQAAKRASIGVPEFICCPYTDWFPSIRQKIYSRWSERWNNGRRHLFYIKSTLGPSRKLKMTRREDVIINRLRLGNTLTTHGYLMERNV